MFALNHVVGVFTVDDVSPWVFLVLAVVDLAAVAVLLGPYRRLRWWAW